MKSSADVLKALYGRRRWHLAPERRQRGVSVALRDYIEMSRPMAQTLVEALCALDLSGRIQFANLSLQRMLGCTEADLLGRSVYDFLNCAVSAMGAMGAADGAAAGAIRLHEALAMRESVDLGACELRGAGGAGFPARCA
ncbi:MAG TPA: PAS domain-containing protein, partial [Ktedonobacterales bacterium]